MKPRFEAVLNYVDEDDLVLDIGCVQHQAENEAEQEFWLHGLLRERSSEVVGIDYLETEVKKLQQRGYDVYCKNAEEFQFDRQFDKIVAGELIEHLSNPGNFLESASKHLTENGWLILTTPNPWAIHRSLTSLLGEVSVNPEHTCWFGRETISELLSRYGFTVNIFKYIDSPKETFSTSNAAIVSPGKLLYNLGYERLGGTNFIVVATQK